MKIHRFSIWLILSVGALAGCVTPRTLGHIPTGPEVFFKVLINSIPSGATVYVIDPNNNSLKEPVGKTPHTMTVGLATRRLADGERAFTGGAAYSWGPGIEWSTFKGHEMGWDLLLNIAIEKKGYEPIRVLREPVARFAQGLPFPPRDKTFAVRLKAKPQPVKPEVESQPPLPEMPEPATSPVPPTPEIQPQNPQEKPPLPAGTPADTNASP